MLQFPVRTMQTFNSFDNLVSSALMTENAPEWTVGGTPPVDPAQQGNNPPPNIPQWGRRWREGLLVWKKNSPK